MNAYTTIYWFMYPKHYNFLVKSGMGTKWNPGMILITKSVHKIHKGTNLDDTIIDIVSMVAALAYEIYGEQRVKDALKEADSS